MLRVSRAIINKVTTNKDSPLVEVKTISMLTSSLRMLSLVRSPSSRIKIRIGLHAMVKASQTCFRWQDSINPAFITVESILSPHITTQY